MIQEFHLSITAVGPDTYLLRTEAVATGVPLAETQVTWPVDDWLARTATLFQDPLGALLAAPTLVAGPDLTTLGQGQDAPWIQLGQSLYQHLFQGRIRDSWLAAQGVAQNRQQPLRLRLGFKESRLQRLPWELLYGDDRPLATGIDITLCRYFQALGAVDLAAMAPLGDATQAVNVLVVISAPNDQERLTLRQEVQQLLKDLQPTTSPPTTPPYPGRPTPHPLSLDLTILEQPGRPELVKALEQGKYQVLHYAGHSDVSDTGGDLFLVNRQTGLTDWLSGEDLAGLLVNNGIRLAVFNSCRGAYTPADDAQSGWREQNLVQALVNRGVPGVMAMAERIPDQVAITFTQLLYRNLRQGHPIDLCLSRVRQGLISAYRSDQPSWMLPILYLRPEFDGYLYSTSATEPDPLETLQSSDQLSTNALAPPDYSTDPDIAGLAQEVFARHDAGSELPPSDPLDLEAPNYLTDLDLTNLEQRQDAEEAASTVAHLVEQLSQPQAQPTTAFDSTQIADPSESLLPQADEPSPSLVGMLPDPQSPHPGHPPIYAGSPGPKPLARGPFQSKPRSIPLKTVIWAGLGLLGLGTSLALALAVFQRPSALEPIRPELSPPTRPGEELDRPTAIGNSEAVIGALQALNTDNPEGVKTSVEQLLDQGDLVGAESVIAAAAPGQLMEPAIAFIRGRLAWQQMVTGRSPTSANDALRAWSQAVKGQDDFLEAWVALGFAHYAMTDYDRAIRAWQRAVDLDRQNLRDIDPEGKQQVASDLTPSAYAGLAMAYQKLSELAIVPREQMQLEQKADTYFVQALEVDPTLLNPQALALQWLWAPAVIEEWQTAIDRLSSRSPSPGAGIN